MKIFQVLCGKTWGGGSVVVHAITRALVDRGDDVFVFSFDEESDRRFREIGAKIVNSPVWVEQISPLDAIIFSHLWNVCRREEFDLVATHTSKGGFLGRLAARAAGVPCIVHHAHGFSFNKELSPLSRRFFIALERFAAHASDMIISVNEQHREMAVALGIESPDRIRTVPNGIDLQPFTKASGEAVRKQLGADASVPLIGAIGRLCEQKGFCYLIAAFSEVLKAFPTALLVIAGAGPLEEELKRQAAQSGLGDSIRFLGFRRDVPELLASFNIYVQPSLWEGHSISLIEAVAAGKPIVATDIDGNREAVVNGETAVLVPAARTDALAQGLRSLLADREFARQLGERAREAAATHFTEKRMVQQNVAAYDAAVRSAKARFRPLQSIRAILSSQRER